VSQHPDTIHNVGCAGYYYRRAIAIDPFNAYYHGRYASSAYWFGDYAECKKHFVRSLKLSDDSADVHRDYGHYLEHIEGRPDLAEQHYLKCLAIYAKDQDCHYFYANLLVQKKRYQEAQTHFLMTFECQQYQRGGNRNGRFHLAFARCLDKMESYEMAQRQYLVCLSLNKFDSVVHLELGQLQCEQLDDYKEGLKHIRTSLNIEFQESTKHILERLETRYDAKREAAKRRKQKQREKRKTRGATKGVEAVLRSDSSSRRNQSGGQRKIVETPGATYCVEGMPSTSTGNTPSPENKLPKKSKWTDDDDEKAQKLKLKEDALKIAQRIRESEFERFIFSQSYLNEKVRTEYLNEFKRRKLNDIILLKIDTNAFIDELGLRNLVHSTLLKKKIERFKAEMDAFHDWLLRLRMEETLSVFEKYGILTFEQFDHHIQSEDDLKWLLGRAMAKHAQVIWNANSLFRARSLRAHNLAASS